MPEIKQDIRGTTFIVAPSDSIHTNDADYALTGVAATDTAMLQDANDRANGGVVKVLEGNVTVTNLTIDNCTLMGQGTSDIVAGREGTTIHVTGNIHVAPGGRLWNVTVEVAAGYNTTALTVGADEEIFVNIPKLLDNIVIYSPENEQGTGLLLLGDGTTTLGYIAFCSFGSIQVRGFEYPVKLYSVENVGDGFVNGNHFDSILLINGKYMLTLQVVGAAAVFGNTFGSVQMQPSVTTVDGITLIGAAENIFEAAVGWDWTGGAIADAFKADAASYGNHVTTGRLDVIADSGYRNRICNQNPLIERVLTVKAYGADFNKLSAAMSYAWENTVNARWTIKVYGRINDDAQIIAKSYVDVIGYNAVIYNSFAGHSVTASNITDCWWRDIIVRKTGVAGAWEAVLFTSGTTDPTVRFDNSSFINEDTNFGANFGLYNGGGAPTYNKCHFRGGQGGASCYGAEIGGAARPHFYECKGEGGSGGNACNGWQIENWCRPVLKGCIGKSGDNQASCNNYNLTGGATVDLDDCSTEFYETAGAWDYDDADNGRFRPYDSHPYQLMAIFVRVDVANVGVTLDIGNAIGGNQVVNNLDIGAAGNKFFTFYRVEQVANGYLYATPSAPINDGDIYIAYVVIKNYAQIALENDTVGFVNIAGGKYLANGSSHSLRITVQPTADTFKANGALFETLHPTVQYAVFMAAPFASVPIYKCALIGLHNCISFAGDDGWVEFTANAFQYPNPGTDWTPQLAGALLGPSLANKKCWLPLNFLKQGDEIISYRLTGDTTEVNNIVLNCKLVRVDLADPLSTTDVAGGAIAAVTVDGVFDNLATLTNPEVVATDRQYTLEMEGSTGVTDSIKVMGAEVKIRRVG